MTTAAYSSVFFTLMLTTTTASKNMRYIINTDVDYTNEVWGMSTSKFASMKLPESMFSINLQLNPSH